MNVLIIEDELLATERLEHLIHQLGESHYILGNFDTVRDSVKYIKNNMDQIDLLFCDVQLADGLSFSIFDHIQVDVPIIFTTAYDEYSLKAFKHNSVDYLLKPVKYKELENAIAKYERIHSRKNINREISELKDIFTNGTFKRRFLVQAGNKFYHKKIEEVCFFNIEEGVVFMHTKEPGKKYMVDYTLDELTAKHLDPKLFFRINRKSIVNIDAVDVVKNYLNQRLQLKLSVPHSESLVVSREKVSQFKQWLNE